MASRMASGDVRSVLPVGARSRRAATELAIEFNERQRIHNAVTAAHRRRRARCVAVAADVVVRPSADSVDVDSGIEGRVVASESEGTSRPREWR